MLLKEAAREIGVEEERLRGWVEMFEWLSEELDEKQVEIARRIKELEDRGFTLAGIRRRLFEEFGPPMPRRFLRALRHKLEEILTFLREDDKID